MINIKLFKLVGEYIIKEIKVLDQQLDYYNRLSEEEKWHIETGKKFNKLISEYPISENESLYHRRIIDNAVYTIYNLSEDEKRTISLFSL